MKSNETRMSANRRTELILTNWLPGEMGVTYWRKG
jgi:hypothetical protein